MPVPRTHPSAPQLSVSPSKCCPFVRVTPETTATRNGPTSAASVPFPVAMFDCSGALYPASSTGVPAGCAVAMDWRFAGRSTPSVVRLENFSRATRPPKPAAAPVSCRVAFICEPATVTSTSSLPIRTVQRAGKPSPDSIGITASFCPMLAARRVNPGVRTPCASPLTSMWIWSGRVPRASTST